MTRGYLFEITDNPEIYPMFDINPNNLTEIPDREFSYLDTFPNAQTGQTHTGIKELLLEYGAEINQKDNVLQFTTNDQFKSNYFKNKMTILKNIINKASLDVLINSPHILTNQINNAAGDAVYFNGRFITFDDFIRMSEPNTTYYISTILIMKL